MVLQSYAQKIAGLHEALLECLRKTVSEQLKNHYENNAVQKGVFEALEHRMKEEKDAYARAILEHLLNGFRQKYKEGTELSYLLKELDLKQLSFIITYNWSHIFEKCYLRIGKDIRDIIRDFTILYDIRTKLSHGKPIFEEDIKLFEGHGLSVLFSEEDRNKFKELIDSFDLKVTGAMKAIGLERVLTRAELEVSDISFRNVIKCLKDERGNKEFFVFGKTLEFISRQTLTLSEGLNYGINFRLSLIDPTPYPNDTEYIKSIKEKAQKSIKKFREFLKNPDPSWTGTIELRKTKNFVRNSFSSFVHAGKRISVMDFDLGEDLNLQYSQVYVHKATEKKCFAAYLYQLNENEYRNAQFVLAYPPRYRYVYVYGLKEGKIILVKKKNKNTWELPGGKIESEEIPEETAKREFLEETGYNINILQSFETNEIDKLIFVGEVGNKLTKRICEEIGEIKFFRFDQFPEKDSLTFPSINYKKFLSMLTSVRT